jgi:transcription elongation factor
MMANGWIRCTPFPSHLGVVDNTNDRICSAAVVNEYSRRIYNPEASTWLAQANGIFKCLKMIRGFEDFGIFHVPPSSKCGDDFP